MGTRSREAQRHRTLRKLDSLLWVRKVSSGPRSWQQLELIGMRVKNRFTTSSRRQRRIHGRMELFSIRGIEWSGLSRRRVSWRLRCVVRQRSRRGNNVMRRSSLSHNRRESHEETAVEIQVQSRHQACLILAEALVWVRVVLA